jgi:hypothetical protein
VLATYYPCICSLGTLRAHNCRNKNCIVQDPNWMCRSEPGQLSGLGSYIVWQWNKPHGASIFESILIPSFRKHSRHLKWFTSRTRRCQEHFHVKICLWDVITPTINIFPFTAKVCYFRVTSSWGFMLQPLNCKSVLEWRWHIKPIERTFFIWFWTVLIFGRMWIK